MRPHSFLYCLLLVGACRPTPRPARAPAQATADSGIIRGATVVAFTLNSTDTLDDDAREKLREFESYTQLVFPMLSEQGIAVRSSHSDTLVVQMENGPARTIMLRGLDFPYGYVLVEPGYPETIMTGVVTDEELMDEANYYFGLEDAQDQDETRKQIVLK